MLNTTHRWKSPGFDSSELFDLPKTGFGRFRSLLRNPAASLLFPRGRRQSGSSTILGRRSGLRRARLAEWGWETMSNGESGASGGPRSENSEILLSLVIPAHNEERRLPSAFEQIRGFLAQQPYDAEIVVVENASRDRTWDVAREASEEDPRIRVVREPVRGKGAAVRRGMLAARGQYRFLCDADLSMPIWGVEAFLPPHFEGIEVVIGSREVEGALRVDEPGNRHLMGRVFNSLVRSTLVPGVQDTQCGFKCFRADAAEAIFSRLTRKGFSFDVEVLVIARHLGFRVAEIPVRWEFDRDSRVRVFRDSKEMAFDVVAIWLNAVRGVYDAQAPRMPSAITRP